MTREQWLADRKKGIGGSDVAGILGISPWTNPFRVWEEKTGRVELAPAEAIDQDREILLEFGSQIEDVIANIYSRVTGRTLRKLAGVTHHPKHPILLGSFDRLVVEERRGVEIKSENLFVDKFGDPGTAEVPEYYAAQCAHYMAIADVDVWDLALMHGGLWKGIYTLDRDPDLERDTIDYLLEWWERHVVVDVPPVIDGSDGCAKYLANKFERNLLPLADAGSEEAKKAKALVEIRALLKTTEATEALLVNQLKAAIGEREGIRGEFGRITWKRTKDSMGINYESAIARARESVAKFVANQSPEYAAEIDAIFASAIEASTFTKAGSRRFLLTPAKG